MKRIRLRLQRRSTGPALTDAQIVAIAGIIEALPSADYWTWRAAVEAILRCYGVTVEQWDAALTDWQQRNLRSRETGA